MLPRPSPQILTCTSTLTRRREPPWSPTLRYTRTLAHPAPEPGATHPNDIRKSACRNEATVRLPCSQPRGPSASKVQEPRHGSARDDPVNEALTSSPARGSGSVRRCHVAPLKGSRGA